MRRARHILFFLLAFSPLAFSQGGFYQDRAEGKIQYSPYANALVALPGATVTVCTDSTCAIQVPLYRNAALSQPLPTNVVTADDNGNFSFFASPGIYWCIYNASGWIPFSRACQVSTTSPLVTSFAQNIAFTGNNTHTGVETFGNIVIAGGNTLSATTLSDYTVVGFSKLNSGFFTTSSVVTKGAFDLYNNATGVIFRNGVFNGPLGRTGTLQAGDTTSGTATWLSDNVYNLPDLSQGGVGGDSGFLYGADAANLNSAVGNCVFGGGMNTTSSAGNLLSSGFGCNFHLVFPTLGHAIEWKNGANTLIVEPSALTGNRTIVPPDASGTMALTVATGTATVDLASVASGACTADSADVTLTGALVGDEVRVTAATALPAGVRLIGRVTASNTGRFQLCNWSGGAVDRASDTYTLSVVK